MNPDDGDPNVSNDAVAPVLPLPFEVIDAGTSKGETLLIDSHGNNYCIKMRRDRRVYWRCCLRTASVQCKAAVIQHDNEFSVGVHQHLHAPAPQLRTVRQVILLTMRVQYTMQI